MFDKHLDACPAHAIWDREYEELLTIPSSLRLTPAHALTELLTKCQFLPRTMIDLGCGNGRHSRFFAEQGLNVTAIDYSLPALNLLKNSAKGSHYSNSIRLVHHDLRVGIPCPDSSTDLILDAYVLCHFISDESQWKVMNEVYRVLKPGGYFIKIHVDSSDAYYLERLEQKTEYGHISFDPANGLHKRHYSLESYARCFAGRFSLMDSVSVNFVDNVRGNNYKRSVFACLMQKA